ncbi:phosphoribosylanthranilate isomerase [Robertmurraya yapensis]|uniref:N-(5'-phosphoribosyl)anthranilate isomerase n=1 Tax=Bacillus yapensis TaxID=2492960 RepID=A0A431W659_9BACI|nr:phosphoribosylanthranilate isomerase [Bacillus yapensis]RTR30985.1 phosphoribosylanthranilate isomerase [Bacillus yapensis]TKS95414.1 phosphoribosylanthranilate isomerase [Bacillus yapensis]
MKVKICGIMDVEAGLYAVENGADALGFVFAESKRKITPELAKEIIKQLPEHVLKVGIFVNEKPEVIMEIANQTGLTDVQLHGDESPEDCEAFSIPVIKALSIGTIADLGKIDQYGCDYVLLDSPKGKYRGGNGVKFDWSLLTGIESNGKKIILAGGLNPENIAEAIGIANPYMVDVSSGVETNGKKDLGKIQTFLARAKRREEVR